MNKKLSSFEQLRLNKEAKIEQKEKELEELKNSYLTKSGNYDDEKLKRHLEKLLKSQSEIIQLNSEFAIEQREEIKGKLVKKTLITIEELGNLCQLKAEITQLKLEIQKNLNQIINNWNGTIINETGSYNNLGGNISEINHYSEARMEMPPK